MRRFVVLAAAVTLSGCGLLLGSGDDPPPRPVSDAGGGADAGTTFDAGPATDAAAGDALGDSAIDEDSGRPTELDAGPAADAAVGVGTCESPVEITGPGEYLVDTCATMFEWRTSCSAGLAQVAVYIVRYPLRVVYSLPGDFIATIASFTCEDAVICDAGHGGSLGGSTFHLIIERVGGGCGTTTMTIEPGA